MRNLIKLNIASFCLLASPFAVAEVLRLPSLFEAEQRATLSANQPGMLTDVNKQIGDQVSRGDLLFTQDTTDLKADVVLARIQLDYAGKKLSRQQQLQKRGMAAPALVTEARQERDLAKAELTRLQQRIEQSKRYAPYSGIIIDRTAEPQEWVEAGQAIMTLLNNQRLRLTVAVPSKVLHLLQPQQAYYAEVPALRSGETTTTVSLTLLAIAAKVESQSDTAQVLWRVNDMPAGLLAGMRGELLLPSPVEEQSASGSLGLGSP